MASAAVGYSGTTCVERKISQNAAAEENETRYRLELQLSHEEHVAENELTTPGKVAGTERLDKGYMQYGYGLLPMRAVIGAICNGFMLTFDAWLTDVPTIVGGVALELPVVMRSSVAVTVIMMQRSYVCSVTLNRRFDKFAKIVVYAWGDTSVEFASCLMTTHLKSSTIVMAVASVGSGAPIISSTVTDVSSHPCVERAMHQDCPVCFEYLFESRDDVIALPCGHTIHKACLVEMQEHYQYACPICSKSVCDMSKVWEKFDMEIAATPMPPYCENKMVWILCNDCGCNSEVKYHVVAHKCPNCKSYNTRQITRGR
ncbi:hypothetical protein C2S53_009367 [Perilla frutescens var. hirtella]|uniref:RING-type domain-containing protein n=1 Tax=Perilla frutescens var. hirtella TaxID=608512 RepID=A0AAD4JCE0_PERFH|nr:hypothetical protein C2S53_009367 [Perilla frutescens var. hirtella]